MLDFRSQGLAVVCSLGLIMAVEQRCMALGPQFAEDELAPVYVLVLNLRSIVLCRMVLVVRCCIGFRIVRMGLGDVVSVWMLQGGSSKPKTSVQVLRARRTRPPPALLCRAQHTQESLC